MPANPDVDAWFDSYDNPMKPAVQRVREIILAADPRITESIKWKAPTFEYKGNIASFYPRARGHVSLMFHQGARIPGEHPLLEGEGSTSRTAKLAGLEQVEARRAELEDIVRAWCDYRDGENPSAPRR
jgi:hypothetical protein